MTQKFKIQKKNKNNNNTQIQTELYCDNKRGRPLPQAIADLRKSEPVSLKVLHWNVKVDASKSHNRRREMAALAAVLDKRWVA